MPRSFLPPGVRPTNVSLEIGPIALTRTMCRPSPLSERFVRDLGCVRSYVTRDGNLYRSLLADGGIYARAPLRLTGQ